MSQLLRTKSLVLYAEDDSDDVELVKYAFEEFTSDVQLLTFSNGSELISYLQTLTSLDVAPCLIILDINMPVLNGKQTLQQMRDFNLFPEVPTVLFTTSSQPEEMDFARQHKVGFVTKPLSMSQMEAIIHLFIDHCKEEVRKKIRKQIQ